MSSTGLYQFATMLSRIEATLHRMEDITDSLGGLRAILIGDDGRPLVAHIVGQTHALPSPPPPPSSPPAITQDPDSVIAFNDMVLNGKFKPFSELTKSFAGGSVIDIVGLVEKQYEDLRDIVRLSSACQRPDQKALEKLISPLLEGVEAISRAKEAGRKDRDWFTHLSFIGEAGASVGWVVHPKPASHIADVKESAQYYGNRLMQEFKSKDPKHVEWVRSFMAVLEAMRQYVIEYHPSGLTWNPKGMTVEAYQSMQTTKTSPPPPPPPPPAPAAPAPSTTGSGSTGAAAAVFAELNRGEEVTKGLRKVDKSEMTHKNPALRAGGTVPSSVGSSTAPKKPVKPAKPQALAGKKPAKFALEGTKWNIEYQENERSLTLEDVEINQVISLYGCKNCTVLIKGKVNAVTIANCQSTSVLVESVVSSISVTRAPSFVLQITGSAPMIQLDSTDSGQIFLSKDSLGTEITTAKCSSINVSLPVEGEEDGVFEEQPVPEMLRTVVKDGKLVTTIVEHV